jgi:hypothetical protein
MNGMVKILLLLKVNNKNESNERFNLREPKFT